MTLARTLFLRWRLWQARRLLAMARAHDDAADGLRDAAEAILDDVGADVAECRSTPLRAA